MKTSKENYKKEFERISLPLNVFLLLKDLSVSFYEPPTKCMIRMSILFLISGSVSPYSPRDTSHEWLLNASQCRTVSSKKLHPFRTNYVRLPRRQHRPQAQLGTVLVAEWLVHYSAIKHPSLAAASPSSLPPHSLPSPPHAPQLRGAQKMKGVGRFPRLVSTNYKHSDVRRRIHNGDARQRGSTDATRDGPKEINYKIHTKAQICMKWWITYNEQR